MIGILCALCFFYIFWNCQPAHSKVWPTQFEAPLLYKNFQKNYYYYNKVWGRCSNGAPSLLKKLFPVHSPLGSSSVQHVADPRQLTTTTSIKAATSRLISSLFYWQAAEPAAFVSLPRFSTELAKFCFYDSLNYVKSPSTRFLWALFFICSLGPLVF